MLALASGLLANWRFAAYGLLVAGLLIAGWTANGWRIEAAQARGARLELRNEQQRRVQSDADRLALQVKLSAAEARIGTGVQQFVTKTIRQYVHDQIDCRLTNPAVIDGLRDLRAGVMPAAAPEPAAARATP